MDNKQKKIVGAAILLGAIAATSVVYARVLEQSQPVEKVARDQAVASEGVMQSNAIAVDGNEIFLYKDDKIIVIDRQSLEIKKAQSLLERRLPQPAVLMPPEHQETPANN